MNRMLQIAFCATFLLASLSACLQGAEETTPLTDAVVFLNFAADEEVISQGDFHCGEALEGIDRDESLLRGGDGVVASVTQGGFATVTDALNANLHAINGREITFGVRVKCSSETWRNAPLLSCHGGHAALSFNLFCLDGAIGAEVGTTGNTSLLQMRARLDETPDPSVAETQWHDVYCRVNGAKSELFLDGRCYDEDFMLGDLRTNDVPLVIGGQYDSTDLKAEPRPGFEGQIDFLAVWDRALTDEELRQLAGGDARCDARSRTERRLGESPQYWTPPNNYGVGDCMPFYADGVFHFIYLLDKNRHGAKNGFGAHQWIQATSRDLKTWKHEPFLLAIDDQNEGSICTGSLFYENGKYYAFYANRTVEHTTPDGVKHRAFGLLASAVSDDGVHFAKIDPVPLLTLPEGYATGTRDPIVFVSPDDGKYHMYATTSYLGKGCWAHAVSDDLETWRLQDPIYTHLPGEPECPDWFKWGDYYYVIANHVNGYYKRSRNPLGPWELPPAPNTLMTGLVNVPKSAPFGDDRRIICGWTRERGFGGAAVFHELIRFEDGTLGERFVPELAPKTESEPSVFLENRRDREIRVDSIPEQFRLVARLSYSPEKLDSLRDFTICYAPNRQIRVSFCERAVYLNDVKLERVDLSSGRLELDCYATNVVVDLCVNGSRTATYASREKEARKVSVVNESAEMLELETLDIYPLQLEKNK